MGEYSILQQLKPKLMKMLYLLCYMCDMMKIILSQTGPTYVALPASVNLFNILI